MWSPSVETAPQVLALNNETETRKEHEFKRPEYDEWYTHPKTKKKSTKKQKGEEIQTISKPIYFSTPQQSPLFTPLLFLLWSPSPFSMRVWISRTGWRMTMAIHRRYFRIPRATLHMPLFTIRNLLLLLWRWWWCMATRISSLTIRIPANTTSASRVHFLLLRRMRRKWGSTRWRDWTQTHRDHAWARLGRSATAIATTAAGTTSVRLVCMRVRMDMRVREMVCVMDICRR